LKFSVSSILGIFNRIPFSYKSFVKFNEKLNTFQAIWASNWIAENRWISKVKLKDLCLCIASWVTAGTKSSEAGLLFFTTIKLPAVVQSTKETLTCKNTTILTLGLYLVLVFFTPCPLSVFLEEPSSDPCYPIRGKNRWVACLLSSRPRLICSKSVTISDL